MEYFERGNVKAIEYSVIGQKHVERDLDNQDIIMTGILSDEIGFMALADGVSSASNSKLGAMKATEVIRDLCLEFFENDSVNQNLDELKVEIVRNWKRKINEGWNECATTLNFLIYFKGEIIVGQIGDGLIVLEFDDQYRIYAETEDFYSTETEALGEQVRRSALSLERVEFTDGFSAYMMSDGIGKEVAEESRIELGNYLNKMLDNDFGETKEELIAWVDSLNNKNGDDKSIGFIRMEG